MQETQVRPLGQEDPLEKEMAAHSSILTREILWMEDPGGLQRALWGCKGSDTTEGLNNNNLGPCVCTVRIAVISIS